MTKKLNISTMTIINLIEKSKINFILIKELKIWHNVQNYHEEVHKNYLTQPYQELIDSIYQDQCVVEQDYKCRVQIQKNVGT